MNVIPITPNATTTFEVDLQNRRYTFAFYYNPRAEIWTVNLSLAGVALVTGQAAVMGVELFRGHANPLIPPALYLAPVDDTTEDAKYAELGSRVVMVEIEVGDGLNVVSI